MTYSNNQAKLVINQSDLNKIQSLNNAQIRPGVPIQLIQSQSTLSHTHRPLSQQQRDALKQLVVSRYDPQTQTLSLTATHSPENDYNNKSFVYTLLDIINECCNNIVTLDLSNNNINSLQPFTKLSSITPQLVNLSLANNSIASLDQLELLGCSELGTHIQQLMLNNNGVCNTILQQYNNDTTVYHYIIQSIFTSLSTLDGQSIQHIIQFDVPPVSNTLPPIQSSYFINEKTQSMVGEFVHKYFSIYDSSQNDRQKLHHAYHENAIFTLSCNANDNTIVNEYSTRSHNILTNKSSAQSINRGHIAIVYTLSQLPHTQHDINNFIADVYSISILNHSIVCTLKGQYLENNTELRQFHRIFILCAPTNESLSKQWNVSILHDMLYIGSSKSFQPQQPAPAQNTMQQNGTQHAEAFFTM